MKIQHPSPNPWRIRLVVPHAGHEGLGVRQSLSTQLGLSPQSLSGFDEYIHNENDQGAREVTQAVHDELLAMPSRTLPWDRTSVVAPDYFPIARGIIDAGRLWGISSSDLAHETRYSLPAFWGGHPTSLALDFLGVNPENHYRDWLNRLAVTIARDKRPQIVIEVHTYDETGVLTLPGGTTVAPWRRPEVAVIHVPHFVAVESRLLPSYETLGIPLDHMRTTCPLEIVGAIGAGLRDELGTENVHHNFPPYNLFEGTLSTRLWAWQYYSRVRQAIHRSFWKFPRTAVENFGSFPERSDGGGAPAYFVVVEARKDRAVDPEWRHHFAKGLAQGLLNGLLLFNERNKSQDAEQPRERYLAQVTQLRGVEG